MGTGCGERWTGYTEYMKMMWKGAISFGLVAIPVQVFTATEEKGVGFHQLHDRDHGRIRYQRVCADDGEEVPFEHIVRGYEYEKGLHVVLTDDDLASIPLQSSRTIEIAQFVDASEIDPIYFQKAYYLVPEDVGIKAYHLLREAFREGGKVAVAKVAFREKEHLAVLRLRRNVLVLETMYWPDEIREPAFPQLETPVAVRPQELEMARSLVENLTEPWDPSAFKDEYREALLELIDRKLAGAETGPAPQPEPAPVVDLLAALRASVKATANRRGTSAVAAGSGAVAAAPTEAEAGGGREAAG
jgi:DNA end-binding protein Ku